MKVLLVDTAKERQEIEDQMQRLGYHGLLRSFPALLTVRKGRSSGQQIHVQD
jgi:hypothetical protein